jgi:small subunit ribosomal protein S6
LAANVYEGMFILDSNRYARDPGGVSGQVHKIIEEAGGKMMASRLWEERRLAYPIDGHRKGTYWLTYFELAPGEITGLNRQCQLNEAIVRHLVLKVEPRLVEALVAHANSGDLPTQSSTKDTKSKPRAIDDIEDLDVDLDEVE